MGIDFSSIVALLLGLVIAITLHEFAHALAGYWLGDDTAKLEGRLSLNPLASVDPFMTVLLPMIMLLATGGQGPVFAAAKPVPFNPRRVRWGVYGAAIIALAGPLTNFVIAGIFGFIINIGIVSGPVEGLLFSMLYLNVGLGVFNLIPFPPLDGSRVIYALVPASRRVIDWVEENSLVAMLLFFIVLFQFLAPFIGLINSSIVNLIVPGSVLP